MNNITETDKNVNKKEKSKPFVLFETNHLTPMPSQKNINRQYCLS